MTLEPIMDKLILEPVDAPERSSGGVHLPDIARNTHLARVVSVGVGGWDKKRERPIPMPDVKPGDTVVVRAWGKSELCLDVHMSGKKYFVCEPADVLAKIVA